jgi:hypothetical protein
VHFPGTSPQQGWRSLPLPWGRVSRTMLARWLVRMRSNVCSRPAYGLPVPLGIGFGAGLGDGPGGVPVVYPDVQLSLWFGWWRAPSALTSQQQGSPSLQDPAGLPVPRLWRCSVNATHSLPWAQHRAWQYYTRPAADTLLGKPSPE